MAKLTVFIPCYNEEGSIRQTVEKLDKALCKVMGDEDYSFWLFDNASKDGTFLEMVDMAIHDDRIRIFRCEKKGKGNVFRAFMEAYDEEKHSEYDLILMTDGDDTYGFEDIPSYKWLTAKCLWTGNRIGYTSDKGYHRFGNRLIRWLFKRFYGADYDIFSGLKIFKWGFLKDFKLKDDRFGLETELAFYAFDKGVRSGMFPSQYEDRKTGESKIRVRDGVKVLWIFTKRFVHDYGTKLSLLFCAPLVISAWRKKKCR